MISASVADSEAILRVLIQKGAEVNEKSKLYQYILIYVTMSKRLKLTA